MEHDLQLGGKYASTAPLLRFSDTEVVPVTKFAGDYLADCWYGWFNTQAMRNDLIVEMML